MLRVVVKRRFVFFICMSRLSVFTAIPERSGLNGVQLLLLRILVGAVSGGMASFCSCPIEVCLVRMQVRGKQLGRP